MTSELYNPEFYEAIHPGSLRSARAVLPELLRILHPHETRSLLDVGCGDGTWLRAAADEMGIGDIHGVDGAHVRVAGLRIKPSQFTAVDLGRDASRMRAVLGRTFDLALCLEVAEHLPRNEADNLVGALASVAPAIGFAAAIPHQGGTGHINEEWPAVWVERFKNHGFRPVDELRARLWSNESVEFWYRQNTLLFLADSILERHPALRELADSTAARGVPSLVHPVLYERLVARTISPVSSRRGRIARAISSLADWLPPPGTKKG